MWGVGRGGGVLKLFSSKCTSLFSQFGYIQYEKGSLGKIWYDIPKISVEPYTILRKTYSCGSLCLFRSVLYARPFASHGGYLAHYIDVTRVLLFKPSTMLHPADTRVAQNVGAACTSSGTPCVSSVPFCDSIDWWCAPQITSLRLCPAKQNPCSSHDRLQKGI